MKTRICSKAYTIFTTFLFLLSAASMVAQNEEFFHIGGWAEGPCNAVNVADQIAYFGNGCVLEIIDFSDAENPVELAKIETPSYIYDIAVQGDLLYIANNDLGLRILDIADPLHPIEVGFLEMQGFYSRVVPGGDIVYFFTNSSNGLYIVDVSTPAEPIELARFDIGDRGGMSLAGEYLFVAARWNGCKVIDVSTPTSPVEVAVINDIYGYDVATEGERAYVSTGDSLLILDISTPSDPAKLGSVYANPGSVIQTADIEGPLAYIGERNWLRIVDVTDPSAPVSHVRFQNTAGFIHDIQLNGNVVYTASAHNGVNVIDVSDVEFPEEIGSYDAAGYSHGIFVRDDMAWVANGYDGLRAFDISDPGSPIQVGYFNNMEPVNKVILAREYAFLANGSNGMLILDIRDLTDLKEVSQISGSHGVYDIEIRDNLAFLARDRDGLRIIDIADPANPVEIGFYETEDRAFNLDVSGDYAYIADWSGGLRIIDISDPANPTETGFLDDIGFIRSVAAGRDYAFVGMSNPYVKVIDISDPANPVFVSQYFTARAQDLIVRDEKLYVSAGYNGVFILDLSDPTDLGQVGYYDTGGEVYETFIYDDDVYLADYTAGMTILHFGVISTTEAPGHSNPESLSIETIYPNPFGDFTTINCSLDRPESITLKMRDAQGRTVKILQKSRMLPGTFVITWDGTDDSGKRVSPGMYFIELANQKERVVQPVIYVHE